MNLRENPTLACWVGLAFIFVAGIAFNILETGARWFTGPVAEIVKVIVPTIAIVSGFAVAAHTSNLALARDDRAREREKRTTYEALRAILISSHRRVKLTLSIDPAKTRRLAHVRVARAFISTQRATIHSFDLIKLNEPSVVHYAVRCSAILMNIGAVYDAAFEEFSKTEFDSEERVDDQQRMLHNLLVSGNELKRAFDRLCGAMNDSRGSPLSKFKAGEKLVADDEA